MIAINMYRTTAMLFVSAAKRISTHRPVQLFVDLVHLVDNICYLSVTLGTETGNYGLLLSRRSGLAITNDILL